MARLAMCGWESGNKAEIGALTETGTLAIQSSGPRNGSYSLRGTCPSNGSSLAYLRIPLAPATPSEVYIRLGVKMIGYPSNTYPYSILRVVDQGTVQLYIRVEYDYSITIRKGDGTSLATLSGGLGQNSWHCVEARFKVNSSTGIATVWIDGIQVANFSGNTQQSANAQITDVDIGAISINGNVGGATIEWDDFAVNDTTDTINNGRIGQGGIIALRPTADTADKDFSRSTGSDNFELVNETQANDETDYVYSGTADDRDLYELANLSGVSGTISAISVVGRMRSEGGPGAQAALTIKSNTTVQEGATKTLTETYGCFTDLYERDPATNNPWTVAGVNALLVGVTVK